MTVLVHSYSDTVLDVLQHVADKGVKINVITTEAHPSNTG
jgi:translation initiation factor 2B subunit (eIF-2B alpha/beta/delta family)